LIDFIAVGKKITQYRKQLSMTQDDLAEKLFVTRQLVSKWELGLGFPTIDALLDLAKLFSISFEELLCLDEETTIDEDNLFSGHNRIFIINQIIKNKLKVNIPDVLYQFSSSERIMVLKAIKEGNLKVNMRELLPRLTPGETRFLKKGGLTK